ncbi:MAG: 5-(carboxyamino)imidazole ribonucleotide synthase [Pseudomonadota bacterium]|jgi:5-(carboxyamino)imidazole ribonucleotide synthase
MKKIGVVGGGQLGQMLALAGIPLGLEFIFLEPSADACAARLGRQIAAEYDDIEGLERLAVETDLVTFEFENFPVQAARHLATLTDLAPGVRALDVAQDRLNEKTLFRELDIPVADFAAIDSQGDLDKAVTRLGLPAVLKTRRLGYDGKGQKVLRTRADAEGAFEELGAVPLILESFVPFNRELSLIAVRGRDGECRFYPVAENIHINGILHLSRPRLHDFMQEQAQTHARRVLESLDYVGALGFEFFQVDDYLLANEIAPRVHNTGHWTIEGAVTSQFENHLRAVLGLPLGATAALAHAAMVNFIGEMPAIEPVLHLPGARWHDYHKDPRPGRKVGHVTLLSDSPRRLEQQIAQVEALMR